jgi:hypothetical protein
MGEVDDHVDVCQRFPRVADIDLRGELQVIGLLDGATDLRTHAPLGA